MYIMVPEGSKDARTGTASCSEKGERESQKARVEYFVAIVKEEYIPEDLEEQVIEKMKTLGFKISDTDTAYDYVQKAGGCIVEICTMEFGKTKKRCSR